MNRKVIYTIIGLIVFVLSVLGLLHRHILGATAFQHNAILIPNVVKKTNAAKDVKPQKIKTIANHVTLMKVPFSSLPGWGNADVKKSLLAFQNSCITFLKQAPTHAVGSNQIDVKASDWQPACKAALSVKSVSEESAKAYFERWFNPIQFQAKQPAKGLFTGYYMPDIEGSLKRTATFNTPIYGLPTKTVSHFTRQQIDNGALENKAPVLAWIKSPVERLSLEIEGSGVIKLPNGERLYVNYAGENGSPYTSIGNVLIKSGVMTRDNASQVAIKRYLDEHPSKMNAVLHQNKSFVFFNGFKKSVAIGAKGMTLTPGYSLAIDKKWIPMGAPLWLATTKPNKKNNQEKTFQRLMIAQDTGGAIKGLIRGDIYWGSGKTATFLGENMRNTGKYWLLLPKYAIKRIAQRFS